MSVRGSPARRGPPRAGRPGRAAGSPPRWRSRGRGRGRRRGPPPGSWCRRRGRRPARRGACTSRWPRPARRARRRPRPPSRRGRGRRPGRDSSARLGVPQRLDVFGDGDDQQPGLRHRGPPAVPDPAGEVQGVAASEAVGAPSASISTAPSATYINWSLRNWSSRPASWSPVNSEACIWWCPRTRERTRGSAQDSAPSARTTSTLHAGSAAASSSTAVVRSASASFSRELWLGRARSFSIWLRNGTDRPLRSATTARVRSSARRRRRTAAPTRRGCSLWSPIAPAPSFAARPAPRAPRPRRSSFAELSAPYACSANRFRRLPRRRRVRPLPTSQFAPAAHGAPRHPRMRKEVFPPLFTVFARRSRGGPGGVRALWLSGFFPWHAASPDGARGGPGCP